MFSKGTFALTPDSELNIVKRCELPSTSNESIAELIESAMYDPGYLILRNLFNDLSDFSAVSARLLELTHCVGVPVSHDENNSLVWNIKKADSLQQAVPTYSEHSGEAFLHTDSQYREHPEELFALLMLKPADCGGGISLLMTHDSLMGELNATAERRELSKALAEERFPFVVPSAFKRNPEGEQEYVFSPILEGEGKLRFRADTLKKALDDRPGTLPEKALRAHEMMLDVLSGSKQIKRFHLQPGDLVFINNRTTLHGRTAFDDPKRHLLRVRLNMHEEGGKNQRAAALKKNVLKVVNNEAESYLQWVYDQPILIGAEQHEQFTFISDCLYRLVKTFAGDYERWRELMPVDASKLRVLQFWGDRPYQPGSYRTDFVYDCQGIPKLIEITCRFALNGFFSAMNVNRAAEQWREQQSDPLETMDLHTAFFEHFAGLLGDMDTVVVIRGDDLRNESRLMTQVFADTTITLITVDYRMIESADLPWGKALFVSELSHDELISLSDSVLTKLAKEQYINDPRTALLVHDKGFFAAITNESLQQEALGLDDANTFRRYLLPAYLYASDSPAWSAARQHPEQWILKHRFLGKSQQIFAGITTPLSAWNDLFERRDLSDFLLQKWEPQGRLSGTINGELRQDYVAGTLLLMDGKYFGPGEFRTCDQPVSNTGSFRKIASLTLKQGSGSFGGRWVNEV